MDPKEYNALKAFRDLLAETVDSLSNAGGQTQLASTSNELATKRDDADEGFAAVVRDVAKQARMMSFAQVRPVVTTIVVHIQSQLTDVESRFKG